MPERRFNRPDHQNTIVFHNLRPRTSIHILTVAAGAHQRSPSARVRHDFERKWAKSTPYASKLKRRGLRASRAEECGRISLFVQVFCDARQLWLGISTRKSVREAHKGTSAINF